jgi:iron(II)-dependent oxidoreductase
MSGNVWEWTSTLWGPGLADSSFRYPYEPQDGRENLTARGEMHRVLRGGAYVNDQAIVRCAYRGDGDPHGKSGLIGFRVAVSGI